MVHGAADPVLVAGLDRELPDVLAAGAMHVVVDLHRLVANPEVASFPGVFGDVTTPGDRPSVLRWRPHQAYSRPPPDAFGWVEHLPTPDPGDLEARAPRTS